MNIVHALIPVAFIFATVGGIMVGIVFNGRVRVVSFFIAIGAFGLLGYVLVSNVARLRSECEAKGGILLSRGYECVKKDALINR